MLYEISMSLWLNCAFILLILLILLTVIYIISSGRRSNMGLTDVHEGFDKNTEVPNVEFPFKNIRDEKGNKLNIIAISAPFRETAHELKYEAYLADGLMFCGISSYLDFPNKITNPFEDRFHEERNHDYISMVTSWIYCFRDPGYKLQYSGLPLLLLTEADLKNPDDYRPNISIQKEYDFIYVCLDDNDQCREGWNWHNRNFDLAKKCFVVMCGKYNLTGLIVGRTNCVLPDVCTGKITVKPFLPFHEFQEAIQHSRFLFAPNISDASPRVITEAMLYNIPVLVNHNILGGWHNVISGVTGETFTSEYDVGEALDKLIRSPTVTDEVSSAEAESPLTKLVGHYNEYSPRQWYVDNRGLHNSGKKLADFLKQNYPNINCPDMVTAVI